MKPILLITGISGRIGSAAARLFSESYQVVGLDVIAPKVSGVDYIYADMGSEKSIKEALDQVAKKYGNQIVSCIHLAAYYNFEGGHWDKYQQITINGTAHLLEGLKAFELEQFVFSSTILVYEPTRPGVKIHEKSSVFASWEYPRSKIEAEAVIKEKRGKTKAVILRIAGVYDDECNSIPISQQIARIYEKKLESHLFPGKLRHGAVFLHMDDLINALKQVVERCSELGEEEFFVLGEEKTLSYQELQNAIGQAVHGKAWWTLSIPKWVAKLGAYLQSKLPVFKKSFIKPWMIDLADDHYELDLKKAENVLGWHPAHRLEDSLPLMVKQLKENPKIWYEKHKL